MANSYLQRTNLPVMPFSFSNFNSVFLAFAQLCSAGGDGTELWIATRTYSIRIIYSTDDSSSFSRKLINSTEDPSNFPGIKSTQLMTQTASETTDSNQIWLNPSPHRGGEVDAPPWVFLEWPPNGWVDRAEILHSLWGIFCATFDKKIDRVRSGHRAMTS